MENETEKIDQGSMNASLPGKIVLLLSGVIPAFSMTGLAPILPAIADHFSRNPKADVLTRLLVSIIGGAVIICAPIAGALADRFGARLILAIGFIACGVAGCAGFFLDDIYALLASRAVVGFGTAAVSALALFMLASYGSGRARNRWFGYWNTIATSSVLIFIPLVSVLGNHSWRRPFLLNAAILPMFVLTLVGFHPDRKNLSPPRAKPAREVWFAKLGAILSTGVPYGFLLFALGAGVILVTPALYIPFHLRDIGIGDPGRIGMAMLPSSVVAATSSFFFGAIRARLSLTPTFVLAFAVAAVGLIMLGLSQTYIQVVLCQMIFSFSVGLIGPNLYALAAITGPASHRARTMGFAKTGLYGGPLLGQVVLEPFINRIGSSGVILFIGMFAFVLTIVELWRANIRRSETAA